MDALAQTARTMAAVRARESARPGALFRDPLAATLAGEDALDALEAEAPQIRDNPFAVIRTRVFDEWLEQVTERTDLRQVVLVAAGMDSRAFRLRWPAGLTLWELDQPAVLDLKERLLTTEGAVPRCERRQVAIDLERDDWSGLLRAAGFEVALPCVWLAEGFFEYPDSATVERLLRTMAALAAPGSHLGADVASQSLLTARWMAPYLRAFEQRGAPWRFGTDQPEVLLARCGWRPLTVREPGGKDTRFGRWRWPVVPRWVPGAPRLFFVTAIRAD